MTSASLLIDSKPSKSIPMRNMTATLCLSIAVLFGSEVRGSDLKNIRSVFSFEDPGYFYQLRERKKYNIYKINSERSNIRNSAANACKIYSTRSEILHCKMGYFLSRAHASMGTLSAVIPHCSQVFEEESFFSNYGSHLLENTAAVLGISRVIDNVRIEILFGDKRDILNEKTLNKIAEKLYIYNKQMFLNISETDLPTVCDNFRIQIKNKELLVEPYLNEYLSELKNSYPKIYEKSKAQVNSLINSLSKLKRFGI